MDNKNSWSAMLRKSFFSPSLVIALYCENMLKYLSHKLINNILLLSIDSKKTGSAHAYVSLY